jgi:hypothetical protein
MENTTKEKEIWVNNCEDVFMFCFSLITGGIILCALPTCQLIYEATAEYITLHQSSFHIYCSTFMDRQGEEQNNYSYSLAARMLLVISEVESHPGPPAAIDITLDLTFAVTQPIIMIITALLHLLETGRMTMNGQDSVRDCTILYCTVLCCTRLYYVILYSNILYRERERKYLMYVNQVLNNIFYDILKLHSQYILADIITHNNIVYYIPLLNLLGC